MFGNNLNLSLQLLELKPDPNQRAIWGNMTPLSSMLSHSSSLIPLPHLVYDPKAQREEEEKQRERRLKKRKWSLQNRMRRNWIQKRKMFPSPTRPGLPRRSNHFDEVEACAWTCFSA